MPVSDLHELAVTAEENLSKLATGLASEAVDADVVTTVERLADVVRRVVRVLGTAEKASAPQASPASDPQQQAAPQAPAAPAPPPASIDQSIQHLHEVMQASAQRQSGG